jgi:type I restriction enzyme S subunit
VLKWAFEGRLTNKEVKEGELPRGWKLQPLKEITSVLGDGLHGTPKYSELGGYYFINGNNLTDGKIEIKENTKRVNVEEYEKYKKPLNDRTILVSINGSLGYTAFYNNEKVVLGKSACYFNLLDNIDKNYVRYYLTSNSFTSYAEKSATGSTIMNVGLKAMREFHVPMPPSIHEQQSIVQEIESRLSVCDKVEETITTSLAQAETLRQSILKKAFEGKLV